MTYEQAIEWLEIINKTYDGFWMGNITDKELNNLFGLGLVEWRHAEQGEPRENFELSDYGIKMLDAQRSFDFYGSSDYDRALAKGTHS
jgi:hypothetical protein